MTPEEAIETGIYDRLTDDTYGITVTAGKYCADLGGVQLYQGQVDLEKESLIQWAQTGLHNGPVVLIIAGNTVSYETDRVAFVSGEYSVDIYIAAGSMRDPHDALDGETAGDARSAGIWQVKSDILDRLLNFNVVAESSPPWVVTGGLMIVNKSLCLYRMTLKIDVASRHELVAWGDRDDLSKIRSTITKDGDVDSLIVQVDDDY